MHPRRLRCSSLATDEVAALLTPCRRGASAARCHPEGSALLLQQEIRPLGAPQPRCHRSIVALRLRARSVVAHHQRMLRLGIGLALL